MYLTIYKIKLLVFSSLFQQKAPNLEFLNKKQLIKLFTYFVMLIFVYFFFSSLFNK